MSEHDWHECKKLHDENQKLNALNRELHEALAEARSWAKHGYEIGQRSCTWSDQGVAPEWLTGSYRPSAEDARLDVLEARVRDVEHRLDNVGRVSVKTIIDALRDAERGDAR